MVHLSLGIRATNAEEVPEVEGKVPEVEGKVPEVEGKLPEVEGWAGLCAGSSLNDLLKQNITNKKE